MLPRIGDGVIVFFEGWEDDQWVAWVLALRKERAWGLRAIDGELIQEDSTWHKYVSPLLYELRGNAKGGVCERSCTF